MKIRSAIALTIANVALAVTVHLAWTALPSGAAVKKALPAPALSDEDRVVGVIAKDSPAVVSIVIDTLPVRTTTSGAAQISLNQDMSNDPNEIGRGTGFLVSADGMIVTNRHVVDDRVSIYHVFLTDGRTFTAQVLDIDPVNDLALIKIDAKNLPFLTIAADDNVRIGQTVIAIGNALGKYANTVTRGILSGVNRSITATDDRTGRIEDLQDTLQTDAAINAGNSGGPLLDLNAQVIGVNTAIETAGQGLGFAIPASEIRKVLSSYARYGAIARPRLGVRYVMISPDIVLQNHLAFQDGALIQSLDANLPPVIAGSPAASAGLQSGDIILEVNGKKIAGKQTLSKMLQEKAVGDQVTLKIARGTTIFDVSVALDAYPPVTP